MYVCMYVCICIYIIYITVAIYNHTSGSDRSRGLSPGKRHT